MNYFNYQVRIFTIFFFFFCLAPSLAAADLANALSALEKKDYTSAYQEFKTLAEKGDAKAQYHLGMLYKEGQGVLQNKQSAAQWFRKAADQGVAEAQFQLANAYDKGEGVGQSNEFAALWYRKSAERGNPWAQANLGVMYAQGQGVKQDLVLAYVWFNLSASQGIDTAFQNREIIGKQMSEEMLKNVRKISRNYFTRYVEPYLTPNAPVLRKGMPQHQHPAEKARLPSNHPAVR